MQCAADADQARTQYEDVSFQIRHRVLPSNVTRVCGLPETQLVIASWSRKSGAGCRQMTLAPNRNSGNMVL
jgi:hypothetical protein